MIYKSRRDIPRHELWNFHHTLLIQGIHNKFLLTFLYTFKQVNTSSSSCETADLSRYNMVYLYFL